jgi:hypothetical protein
MSRARSHQPSVSRRQFVQQVSAAAVSASLAPRVLGAAESAPAAPESLVKTLYQSFTPEQKESICFPWDYTDDRGLLRMHVANNWQITEPKVATGFFTSDQQEMIEAIFWGLYSPEWKDRIRKQLRDDAGGYGKEQSIALFGSPDGGPFEFVMTGRHLTIRCDGNSVEHAAFGGPIFYGHAAEDFNEAPNHPGNVFWYQAERANGLYKMLDGKQREHALIPTAPRESAIHFRGAEPIPGLPIAELTADQKAEAQQILSSLLEPYRAGDQAEVRQCLEAQGGLDQCRLAFYQSGDLGNDGIWDNWRIEGPSFVWHYRGTPHVHVWVNVANSPEVKITAEG